MTKNTWRTKKNIVNKRIMDLQHRLHYHTNFISNPKLYSYLLVSAKRYVLNSHGITLLTSSQKSLTLNNLSFCVMNWNDIMMFLRKSGRIYD